jgi:mannose-6-phosphate isomerase-like protein (cupin superfamily)
MNKSTFNDLKVPNRSVALGAIKKITAAVKGRHLVLAAIVAMFSTGAFSTVAVATPPSGIVSATVFARANFADPTGLSFTIRSLSKGQHNQYIVVPYAHETVVQQIIIAPGGHTGWHSHPGPVVVLIKSGQMSFYDSEDPSCTVRTYPIGQSFVDRGQGHVHIARNEGSENLELWATYFDVPPGGAFRIDAANPGNCPF